MLVIWVMTLLPVGLLVAAFLYGSRRDPQPSEEFETDRASWIRFARGFTLASCLMVVFVNFGASQVTRYTNLPILNLFCITFGPLAGLTGLSLFLLKARGIERVLGSVSAGLATAVFVFLIWAELVPKRMT